MEGLTAGSYATRKVSALVTPVGILFPGFETEFVVSGNNLAPPPVDGALYLKVASACVGGDESDVAGGSARAATCDSASQARANFTLGPVEDGVHVVAVEAGGGGYLTGALNASGGGGSGFQGVAVAGAWGGEISQAYVTVRGTYSSAPTVRAA